MWNLTSFFFFLISKAFSSDYFYLMHYVRFLRPQKHITLQECIVYSTGCRCGCSTSQHYQKAGHNLGFYLTTSLCLSIGIPSPPCRFLSPWLLLTVPHPRAGFQSPSTSVLSCTHACRIAWLTPFWIPQMQDSLFWVSPSLDNSWYWLKSLCYS